MSEHEPTRTYSNPTATEVLRRLLDERGVEWWETTSYIGATITSDGIERHYLVSTWWNSPVFGRVEATDMGDGVLHMARLNWCGFTPAQAIAATLGSCNCPNNCTNGERTETCQMEYVSDWMSWHCKSCDHMDMAPRNPKPRYCKWCGRKVVEPTTNDVDVEVDA